MKIQDRLKHAWNAFTNTNHLSNMDHGYSSSRPTHKNMSSFNTTGYVSSIYNRIAIDTSMTEFKHVKIDPETENETILKTSLHNCLTVEANLDQTHVQFIQDLVYSMFDEGVVAVVPIETTVSPSLSGAFDIHSLRVGKVRTWYPRHVEVEVYNENTGQNERVVLEKKNVAIVENPLYAVVNSDNSTLKRLIRKLHQLDDIDAQAASSRLDLLISIPYGIKTDNQRIMAEKRIKDIEAQLASGRNGIAYIDGTEKAMQLNRPVNSQLTETIDKLTEQFYNQLGLTETIFNGTASETELKIYYTRTIDPILVNVLAEINRKFLTKTARTQGHKIAYFRDMFKMVPVEAIANLGDSFRRNEIASSNELRKLIGLPRANDPKADQLFNPNMPGAQDPSEESDYPNGTQEKNELTLEKQKELIEEEKAKALKENTHLNNREKKEMLKKIAEKYKK